MSQLSRASHKKNLYQAGQGVVEYILLLVVVLGIGYALLNRLFTPVRAFTDFYIGQYIDCLLDQGELPKLSGSEDTQDCDYQAMTSGGLDGQSGAGSNSNSNTNSPGSENSGDKANSEDSNSVTNSQSAARGQNRRLQVSGGRGADYQGRDFGAGKRTNLGNPESLGPQDGSESDENSFSANISSSNASRLQRRRNRITRVRGLAGEFYGYESGKKAKSRAPILIPREKIDQESDGGPLNPRNKRLTMDTQKSKDKEIDLGVSDWSFGKIFRMALIIIVLLAIVWVIGSQVAQVSRNME